MEFATFNIALFTFEVRCNQRHSSWVAHKYYLIGKLFWFKVEVENASVSIDDEFRLGKEFRHNI